MDDAVLLAISMITSVFVAYAAVSVRLHEFIGELAYVKSQVMSVKGAFGGQARTQNAERLEAALGEAMVLFQSGTKPEEIFKVLAPKYPDVIAKVGMKLAKGQM